MKTNTNQENSTPYDFEGKLPLKQAIPLGLQHVLAMFVGNLTPILIITSACAAMSDAEQFAAIQVSLLQNAMLIAGVVTLIQLFAIGPVGGKVPIIMGTSSGFIGVFQSVAKVMGGGILGYAAIMGASIIGGLFEGVLGFLLKPLRRFFPAVVTGTVVLSIGLSLISVGVGSFGGGSNARYNSCGLVKLKNAPTKFETGTPNIEGVIGLGSAIEYLQNIGMKNIEEHEAMLRKYAVEKMKELDNIEIYNENGVGAIAFNIKNVFSQDGASLFNTYGIAIRAGQHCAKILDEYLHVSQTLRASFYFYNTKEEIDQFIEVCKKGDDFLDAFFG